MKNYMKEYMKGQSSSTKFVYYSGMVKFEIIPNVDKRRKPTWIVSRLRVWNPLTFIFLMFAYSYVLICSPFVDVSVQKLWARNTRMIKEGDRQTIRWEK